MSTKTEEIWICPKCCGDMSPQRNSLRCTAGHTYDRAREGYYNFLLGAGGAHGDNRNMLTARRAFLETGSYAPLAQAVSEEVAAHLPEGGVLLDAGAGEGYYTAGIAGALRAEGRDIRIYAVDVSRDAVRMTAKRDRTLQTAVASVYHLPVRPAGVDVVLNMFAPFAREEYLRVLCPGGVLVMAIPEREHLFGLKAAIYDTPYKNEVAPAPVDGFTLLAERELRYSLTLPTPQAVAALFAMTPYAYRTSSEGRARVAALRELTTEVHFRIFTYRKD